MLQLPHLSLIKGRDIIILNLVAHLTIDDILPDAGIVHLEIFFLLVGKLKTKLQLLHVNADQKMQY